MALLFDYFYIDLFALVVTITVCLITYFKWCFKYWENHDIPQLQPSFPFGTMANPVLNSKPLFQLSKEQYMEAKAKGYDHVGLYAFASPIFMPISPDLVKNIMQSDFQHFVDRGVYYNEKEDPLSAHLFSIEGAKWRNLRMKLTPTFTSGKMKMMFDTLVDCSDKLKHAMDKLSEAKEPVDIKDVLARFTTDIIGSCAFGLDCNSFEDADSEFRKYGKRIFVATKLEALKGIIAFATPWLARLLGIVMTPKESSAFFLKVIRDTVEYREKNKVDRKDFMKLLLDLKNHPDDGKGLTFEELAAQAYVFFIAGYETSSTTMTFCLYELAMDPTIQERVRHEIEHVLEKHDGKITYDAIMEMKYMEQVVDETLRKYPPLSVLNRKCVKDYPIPGTDVVLKEGTSLLIPVVGLQHDAEYYPDPEKFDPERFSPENKPNLRPFTYMPFGEGPRICIGLRFGMMQTKVGLTVLLKNYKVSLNNKTKIPLQMDPFSFITSTLGDMWLNVDKI